LVLVAARKIESFSIIAERDVMARKVMPDRPALVVILRAGRGAADQEAPGGVRVKLEVQLVAVARRPSGLHQLVRINPLQPVVAVHGYIRVHIIVVAESEAPREGVLVRRDVRVLDLLSGVFVLLRRVHAEKGERRVGFDMLSVNVSKVSKDLI